MDINISSQIVVQTAAQWAADNTVYSAKRILVTSDAFYGSTDQRKFKIADGVQTWSNLDYVPISETLQQVINNGNFLQGSILSNNAESYITFDTVQGLSFWSANGDVGVSLQSGAKQLYMVALNGISLDSTVINLPQSTASRIVETDASKNLTYAAKGTAYNKNFGTGTTNIVEIGNTLNFFQLLSTDANGKLQTLTTATYPSLTELSYVKGLTSAIQTQLNSKGYTLIGGTSAITPADSTTYFFGGVQSQSLLSAENVTTKMPIPKTGTIKAVQFSFIGNGSNEASTMLLRLNATTDYTISATTDMSSSLVANYALSIPVTQGDTFCFKWTTPAWGTNPANLRFHIVVYIE